MLSGLPTDVHAGSRADKTFVRTVEEIHRNQRGTYQQFVPIKHSDQRRTQKFVSTGIEGKNMQRTADRSR